MHHFVMALEWKGRVYVLFKFSGIVFVLGINMDVKHWSKEGRQTFLARKQYRVADTLLQRHGGAFVSLSSIITYKHDVYFLMNEHAGRCACLVYVFLPSRILRCRL